MFAELDAQRDKTPPFPVAGATFASFDVGHGYQVEYLAPNGRVFLWYPGNRSVLAGQWKRVLDEVCYRYGPQTYNPQTFQRGGSWNCEYAGKLAHFVVGYEQGDVFRLSSGRVPYVRTKCDLPKGMRRLKKMSCKP